jgi:hypothetical protein
VHVSQRRTLLTRLPHTSSSLDCGASKDPGCGGLMPEPIRGPRIGQVGLSATQVTERSSDELLPRTLLNKL